MERPPVEFIVPKYFEHPPRSSVAVDRFLRISKPNVLKTYEEYSIGKPSHPLDLPFVVKIHLPKELITQIGNTYVEISIDKNATIDDLLKQFFDKFGTGIIAFRNVLLEKNYAGLVLLSSLCDGDELVDSIFQFIRIHSIEADYLSAFVSTHGVQSRLLEGLLENWMFEKEKLFLDTFFFPIKMRVQNGLFEIDANKILPSENRDQNIGYICNLIKQLRNTLSTALQKLTGETVYIFYTLNKKLTLNHLNSDQYALSKLFFRITLNLLSNEKYPRTNADWKFSTNSSQTTRLTSILFEIFNIFLKDIDDNSLPDVVKQTFNKEIEVMAEIVQSFFKNLRPMIRNIMKGEMNESIERTVLDKLLRSAKEIFKNPINCPEFNREYPNVSIELLKKQAMDIQNVSSNYHLRVPNSMYYIKVSQVQMTPIGEWEYVRQRLREFKSIEFECVDTQLFERDKIVLFDISTIIDGPMKWDCTNPQEFYFRRCSYHSAKDMNIPFIPISSAITAIPYPKSFPETFFIKLQISTAVRDFCQLDKQSNTLQVNYLFKPSMIIDKYLRSIQKVRTDFEVNNNIFYLKTLGFDEYMFDDVPIGDYQYIREMLRMSKPIRLMLVLEAGEFEKKLQVRQRSEELEKNWEFQPLPIELPNMDIILPHCVMRKKLGIYVQNIEMTDQIFTTNSLYVVLLEICFGGEVMWSSRSSVVSNISNEKNKFNNLNLNQWIIFDSCRICDIPKEAMLVFKVIEVDKEVKIKKNNIYKGECRNCHLSLYSTKGKGFNMFCSCGMDLSPNSISSENNTTTIIGWTDIYLFDYRKLMISGNYSQAIMLPPVIPIGIPVTEFGNLNQLNGKIQFKLPIGPTIQFDNSTVDITMELNKKCELNEEEQKRINTLIVTTNLLKEIENEDKELIWRGRQFILNEETLHLHPSSIVLLCQSVPWNKPKEVKVFEQLIQKWPKVSHIIALRLLHFSFANSFIRQYAVKCLVECNDEHLSTIMMQLIQSLKFEATPLSDLAIFLIHRALNKRSTIGRIFFWLIKSELHIPETQRRFALLLEAFLMVCGAQRTIIKNQLDLCKKLTSLYTQQNQTWKTDINQLTKELNNIILPQITYVPFKSSLKFTKIVAENCKVLDSLRKPLFLTFKNEDPEGDPIYIIFKKDDDLRQDMFALKVLEVMNQMWQNEGYDMRLTCYECLAMGNAVGMIEVVLRSETIAAIQKKMYGGNVSAAFQEDPLYKWLKDKNANDDEFLNAQQNFIYSCAGYCVATYVLGVGDRHNDNILLTPTGHLVHIDFGHILGNVEKFKGFKRETAPFVLTKEFVYVMGGKNSEGFRLFVNLCCDTFLILRKNYHGLVNLFTMMLSTGLPELRRTEDMVYLLNSLVLDMNEVDARAYFEKLINVALEAVMTRVNNAIHIFAHPDVKEDV
ncbi:hypothetical protein ENUP19_0284G0049 [Entamoeba nuttalli]|uniref:Phosphatidylinositol 3-kinase n=2 Tax=Entamoeba nuttalli TaxID=412467 RepID=A0ABQ0DTY8_9EUKA